MNMNNLTKVLENEDFIIYEDTKGYDFAYVIYNKCNRKIIIQYGDFEEEIEVNDWLGLFINEEYIIDEILNGNYTIK